MPNTSYPINDPQETREVTLLVTIAVCHNTPNCADLGGTWEPAEVIVTLDCTTDTTPLDRDVWEAAENAYLNDYEPNDVASIGLIGWDDITEEA